MSQWEDVHHDDQGTGLPGPGSTPLPPSGVPGVGEGAGSTAEEIPFAGITQVDGLVYHPSAGSPELAWQHGANDVPLPPVRPRPQPRTFQRAEPWKPGPDPEPVTARSGWSPWKALLVSLVPLALIGGLAWLVYQIMQVYGF